MTMQRYCCVLVSGKNLNLLSIRTLAAAVCVRFSAARVLMTIRMPAEDCLVKDDVFW